MRIAGQEWTQTMSELNWKSRIADGRDAAQATVDSLSASAREAAAAARSRIGSTYGVARERANDLTAEGRELASSGIELSSKAAAKGRKAMDKALFSSRDLIAERPITAVVVGIAAGTILGFLANRLTRSAPPIAEEDDEELYGS